jgi:signal transduction histidine kinase
VWALSTPLGFDAEKVRAVALGLHVRVERRCSELGVDALPAPQLYLQCIESANTMLGRLNGALERRAQAAGRQRMILDAVSGFHGAGQKGANLEEVLGAVAASAASVLGAGFYAVLHQEMTVGSGATSGPDAATAAAGPRGAWLVAQFNHEGRLLHSRVVEAPGDAPELATLEAGAPAGLELMNVLPWVADELHDAGDLKALRVLPLTCGWGTAAVLVHDRPVGISGQEMRALIRTWGSAIAAAAEHDRSRRLGEELATSTRALAEAQDRLLQNQSMARLGEMAAGAAHEMNNPLTVICGRAELLASRLPEGTRDQDEAQMIAEQARRLSELVHSLRLLVEKPACERTATEIARLVEQTLGTLHREITHPRDLKPIEMHIQGDIGELAVDPKLVAQALLELLRNAMEAQPKSAVRVTVRWERDSKRLVIEVRDDGLGMDAYTLEHAMDPFFSAKPAGRRLGLGLARARQNALAHEGDLELRSTLERGTTAVLTVKVG